MARYSGGWVKLHRKILRSWVGQDGYALAIMTTLVLWANRKPGTHIVKGQLRPLARGQLVTSSREIGDQLGWDRKTVERKIFLMEKDGILSQELSHHGRMITLIKYVVYQDSKKKLSHTLGHTEGHTRPTLGATLRPHSGEEQEDKNSNNPPYPPFELEAQAITNRLIGGVRKGMPEDEARQHIGAKNFDMLMVRYRDWADCVKSFHSAYRKSSPTIVEGQFRKIIAALLSENQKPQEGQEGGADALN